MSMLTPDVLKKLKVGNQIEAGKLFPGLDPDEPLVWLVQAVTRKGGETSEALLDTYYHGVFLRTYSAKLVDKGTKVKIEQQGVTK